MHTQTLPAVLYRRPAWNKGRLIGQKRPLLPKHVWAIRVRLEIAERVRDLPLFNTAIDSKLRGCDLVRMKVADVFAAGQVKERTSILQTKTRKPVRFELTEGTRASLRAWLDHPKMVGSEHLWPGRFRARPHISTRQYARLVRGWITSIGLEPSAYGTHSMRRTKVAQIYRKTGNLRAVQLLLGHTKMDGEYILDKATLISYLRVNEIAMNLTDPIFTDKAAAREYLERQRWADGVYCPHCGGTEKCKKLEGKSHRPGLYQCGDCRQQFTVTVGTVFERSKVPLNKWLLATFLMASSKKGISAHQLHRTIGVTYKTAWFMFHRIREAMLSGDLAPMGGNGGTVESDETFIGQEPGYTGPRNVYHHKMKVLSLIDRETGEARSFVVDKLRSYDLVPILKENIDRETRMVTDQAPWYRNLGDDFAEHQSVDHSIDEYVRGDVTTNTVEGYYSIFKRGMKGIYQHCGKQHLHRYLAEFDFRYTNRAANDIDDTTRANLILKGAEGKRLTYRRADSGLA